MSLGKVAYGSIGKYRKTSHSLHLINMDEGEAWTESNPDTAYVEMNSRLRFILDYGRLLENQIRIVGRADGNEAGTPKGVEIYDNTNSVQLCEHTWAGNMLENIDSGWQDLPFYSGEAKIHVRVKGSSATEDLNFYGLYVQFRKE